ncbi:MAG: hypothetical protein NTW79_03645 [Candidatus Berkelbacteria bacterium]|nr:hypothetical protein [Candidatus Berkelbacteria bacterium]
MATKIVEATDLQIERAKCAIAQSNDAEPFCKQVLFCLIDASEKLTRSVKIGPTKPNLGQTMAYSVHAMNAMKTTLLPRKLSRIGLGEDIFHWCVGRKGILCLS